MSGTDLTKNNKCEDIYSCLFNDKGNRICQTTYFSSEIGDLALSASIAIKRAECKPLNKHERKAEYGSSKYAIVEFILCLLIAGGMFSVLFNLIFYPVMFLLGLLFDDSISFGEFMSQMPWLFSLLFCWISFGGLFGLVDGLSKRK